jgi:hypothetical protein
MNQKKKIWMSTGVVVGTVALVLLWKSVQQPELVVKVSDGLFSDDPVKVLSTISKVEQEKAGIDASNVIQARDYLLGKSPRFIKVESVEPGAVTEHLKVVNYSYMSGGQNNTLLTSCLHDVISQENVAETWLLTLISKKVGFGAPGMSKIDFLVRYAQQAPQIATDLKKLGVQRFVLSGDKGSRPIEELPMYANERLERRRQDELKR